MPIQVLWRLLPQSYPIFHNHLSHRISSPITPMKPLLMPIVVMWTLSGSWWWTLGRVLPVWKMWKSSWCH